MTGWATPRAAGGVRGRVVVPGSKSASARCLLLAALSERSTKLSGVLISRDTALMRTALATLGAGFEELPDGRLLVDPIKQVQGGGRIDIGLAGTVLRFLPPVAALATEPTLFTGDPAASARPVGPLLGSLAKLGAAVSLPYELPFRVSGAPDFAGGVVEIDASSSSQFISALLLVGARYAEGIEVRHLGTTLPSRPHIEMTCRMLSRRGVAVSCPDPLTWRVAPGPITGIDDQVEPDLTNAATFLAAAVVTGGELTAAWPQDSAQAADQLAGVLAAFGGELSYSGTGSSRELTVRSQGVRGASVDLHEVSELTPVAAALAAVADGPSQIRGVAHVRGHETNRLSALAAELGSVGVTVAETRDGLLITPGKRHGAVFGTHGDHRMAHAGALIGLVTDDVELDDVTCTTKTLPDFPGMWTRLVEASP